MSVTPAPQRLWFLDWIRILAFFLLIVYHTGMYYVSWGWHVKSPHAGTAIEPLMLLSSPWRLSLLFLVSGVACACLARKLAVPRFLRERSARLLLPLLFGMLVVVPPQSYFEVVEKLGYAGSYGDFMRLYLRGYHGFCNADGCLDLPTWNHLWFVAYLWVYALVLAALLATGGPALLDRCGVHLARLLTGWRALMLPAAALALVRIALRSRFGETHALVDDWFNHATYLPLFLLGAALAGQQAFWRELERLRFAALGLALACWLGILPVLYDEAWAEAWLPLVRAVWATCQWAALVAVCGFGRHCLDLDNAARRYLTQAVFPVYIAHQTLIICFSRLLAPLQLPALPEGLLLVALTLAGSFGLFELVRRLPLLRWLRPLVGLKLRDAPRTDAAAAPVAATPG
ncbi:surface polysaccharide O-acyltransferase-like enzyme [Pseudoduganella lurida]|uniref:Surface polysaccharide O-acyltransferase-like enzyme n=1 Tax=Pseudoduganella lurida TaxID=1036180 RepID=A0A562RF61_9BURK|nr:acyltransferase family protein [Pseudoduganella lurida]TWI67695.1 surface polysaccharide O-acyltransferase-like enzyme [Pseudoduganella lurida]